VDRSRGCHILKCGKFISQTSLLWYRCRWHRNSDNLITIRYNSKNVKTPNYSARGCGGRSSGQGGTRRRLGSTVKRAPSVREQRNVNRNAPLGTSAAPVAAAPSTEAKRTDHPPSRHAHLATPLAAFPPIPAAAYPPQRSATAMPDATPCRPGAPAPAPPGARRGPWRWRDAGRE